MNELTQLAAETPGGSATSPSLRDDLAVLDAHAERVLAEVTERVQAMEVEARRGLKALALAPSLPLYHALLAGERVPWNTLDYWQAARYKLRRRVAGTRVGLGDFNDVPEP